MDKYTKLLLHCNGANASVQMPDVATPTRNWSCEGGAALATAQKRFGPSSFRPDTSGAGYLYATATDLCPLTDLSVGASEDFTVEGWAYPTSSGGTAAIFTLFYGATYHPIYITHISSEWRLYMASAGAGSWDIANNVKLGDVTLNAWQHLAVSRTGSDINGYVGGALVDVATSSAALTTLTAVNIGGYTGGQQFYGYLDEIRASKGIGRYPAAFTPLAAPFTDRGHVLRPGRRDRWLGW